MIIITILLLLININIAQHGMQHQPEHKAHGISQPSETTKSSKYQQRDDQPEHKAHGIIKKIYIYTMFSILICNMHLCST